jgi:hypothetical protein
MVETPTAQATPRKGRGVRGGFGFVVISKKAYLPV